MSHRIKIKENNDEFFTFEDVLPNTKFMKILFIAKVPAPKSVEIGHYFQGSQGKAMWNRLQKYDIIKLDPDKFEDDCLIENNCGITDIVKKPREFGDEPADREYIQGTDRIISLIENHKPKVIIFIYKRVLDSLLKIKFKNNNKSKYGFNDNLESLFGTKVFVFPMPGTPCKTEESNKIMLELKNYLEKSI